MTTNYVHRLGPCSVPCGRRGPWEISEFTVEHANWFQAARNPEMYCPPGTYKRLVHKERGVVMSNTRMERNSNFEAFRCSTNVGGRMNHDFNFSDLTIPIGRWTTCWAQCKDDGVTRELWVGTETESCLIGHVVGREHASRALDELMRMMEAVRLLKGMA